MSKFNPLTTMRKCTLVRIIITRVVCLSFVALALVSFPEAQKLRTPGYHHEGNTIYIPLQICQPSEMGLDDSTATFEASGVGNCRTLNFLITACECSLLLSVAATLIFLVIDACSRYGKGAFNRSSVAGMGFFLIFILIQKAVSTWALVSETMYWTRFSQDIFGALDLESINVRSYGNSILLLISSCLALATALVVFVEALINIRNSRNREPKFSANRKSSKAESPKSVETSIEDAENASPTNSEEDNAAADDHVRAWTSY